MRLKHKILGLGLFFPIAGFAFPPGNPASAFGPSQVAAGIFFDHSGQDVFEDPAGSVLNSTGLSLDYAPWQYLQLGVFAGGGEFDIAVPASKKIDTSAHAYNANYNMLAGGSGKLATPRFANGIMRAVGFGSAGYLNSSDDFGNARTLLIYNAGLSLQFLLMEKLNLILGGEFYALDGQQTNGKTTGKVPFGISIPNKEADYFRGIVGVEYFFKGKNKPFISVAFRPSANTGWDDKLGLKNASISISLGAMAAFGKGKIEDDGDADQSGLIDQ